MLLQKRRNFCCFRFFMTLFIVAISGCSVGADDGRLEVDSYFSVRTNVDVSELKLNKGKLISEKRPKNFFQNAGPKSDLCMEFLESLNSGGNYSGSDLSDWLADAKNKLEFSVLPAGVKKEIEYLRVDVDGDGVVEHVYRRAGVVGGKAYNRIMIVERPLHVELELLKPYVDGCNRWRSDNNSCDNASEVIRFLIDAPLEGRHSAEWVSTRTDILYRLIGDKKSSELIFPAGDGMADRNVGSSSNVRWELYEMNSRVVMVSVPVSGFAPPELLVFSPAKRDLGKLHCVVVPLSW